MARDLSAIDLNLVARRLARQCREIIQSCLREEEWLDAEDEFARVILTGLREATSSHSVSEA